MSIQLSLLPREQLHSISQIVNAHLRLVSGIARQFGNARCFSPALASAQSLCCGSKLARGIRPDFTVVLVEIGTQFLNNMSGRVS